MKHRYLLLLALIASPVEGVDAQVPRREPPLPVATPRPPRAASLPEHDLFRLQGELVPPHAPAFAYAPDLPHRTQWYQGDPADSLYRAAYGYFSKQEYRQAADRFADVRSKHPSSRYFCDAAYFESFARYRLGTANDLRTAYRALDGMASRCSTGQRGQDVPELLARVNGAMARLGDADAAERVKRAATQGQNVCDGEDRNVRIEALNALAQLDPAAADPVLRAVLNTRDECSAPIRRQALTMVARRNDPQSVTLLGQVIRNDPDRNNQLEAVRALGRMSNDAAYAALDDYMRSATDERVALEAAATLARSDHPRAQAGVRALIERKDIAERTRLQAISSLASRGSMGTEYWRGLYGKVESDELRKAVIAAIAKAETEDGQQFLVALARNPAESYAAREAAISRIRATAPIADLYKLMEIADSRSMRLSIVSGLAARKEPEATDRLIDILKTGTDVEVRNAALRVLRQSPRSQEPKVIKALEDIALGRDQL